MPMIVATGMRNPRMQGTPPICFASTVIRVNFIFVFQLNCRLPRPSGIVERVQEQTHIGESNRGVESFVAVRPRPASEMRGDLRRSALCRRQRHVACRVITGNSAPPASRASPRRLRAARLGRRPRVVEPRRLREAVALALLRHRRLRAAHLVGARDASSIVSPASESSPSIGVRSSMRSAMTWMTPCSFCSLPVTATKRAPSTIARKALERLRPDDDVGDARLVLERHEDDALGGAGPLAHQHEAGDGDALAAPDVRQARRSAGCRARRGGRA